MSSHGVNVVVRLNSDEDWLKVNDALDVFGDRWLGAGTGFGCRDVQLEAADATDAATLAADVRAALVAAGLGAQIEVCAPYREAP